VKEIQDVNIKNQQQISSLTKMNEPLVSHDKCIGIDKWSYNSFAGSQ
jgi:hypothetical protein